MTTKRIALLTSACCVLALGACNRDDIEPAGNSDALRKGELPAEVAVREHAQAEERAERQDAPEAREGQPANQERAANDPAASARVAAKVDGTADTNTVPSNPTMRRAQADLDTVGSAELDAKAVFEERPDGVAVRVDVEDGKPGTRSVRIYDRESCDDLAEKGLGKPFASIKHGNLGSVTIGESGKGTLEFNAPSSTLKADDRASLLGKTIVVQERSDGDSPKAAGGALACGVIRLDEGLADKAGRMTAPAR